MKVLRDPVKWTALVRACPRHAHWLDGGEPITPVMAMGGVVDRVRSPQRKRRRSRARRAEPRRRLGLHESLDGPRDGVGLVHAGILRRVVREHGDQPAELVASFAAATDTELRPWYESTVLVDRSRMAEIDRVAQRRDAVASEHIGARIGRRSGPR